MPALILMTDTQLVGLIAREIKASETRLLAALSDRIAHQGVLTMDALEQLRQEQAKQAEILTKMGTDLAEVSADMDDVLKKLADAEPGSDAAEAALGEAQAFTTKLADLGNTLRGVADKFTPAEMSAGDPAPTTDGGEQAG